MASKAPKPYAGYLWNKSIVGYGIINGIINALIFLGINAGNADGLFDQGKIVEELALTGALLGMILTWCVVPLTKMDLRNGAYTADADAVPAAVRKLPGKSIPMSIALAVVAGIAATAVTWVCTLVLPLPLDRTGMMIFKGVMCALTGCLSGYLVIGRVSWGFAQGEYPAKSK